MARRVFCFGAVAMLLVITTIIMSACGSSSGGTTTSSAATAGAAETAGAPTSSGSGTTAATTTAEDYKAKMSAWVNGPLQKLDNGVFDIPDPANATKAQIDAVAAFVTKANAALDQLKTIKPSAEALQPHTQFVRAYEELLAATEKFVSAMRSKNAGELATIEQAMSAAQVQIEQSVAILAPMIGMATPTT